MIKERLIMFLKAQLSAFIGGITDYAVMISLTEFFHIHYTISICIGGTVGAIVNFSINRNWTFDSNNAKEGKINTQIIKFITMVSGSIFLKSAGTYLVTTGMKIDYKISRIIVDIIVSLGFNYTLQKYWIFKKPNKLPKTM